VHRPLHAPSRNGRLHRGRSSSSRLQHQPRASSAARGFALWPPVPGRRLWCCPHGHRAMETVRRWPFVCPAARVDAVAGRRSRTPARRRDRKTIGTSTQKPRTTVLLRLTPSRCVCLRAFVPKNVPTLRLSRRCNSCGLVNLCSSSSSRSPGIFSKVDPVGTSRPHGLECRLSQSPV
jgi:hypothetical protein